MKRAEQKALTKRRIQQAFLHILSSKKIENITVTEIAGTANIDRKTFYLYFPTIYSVLISIEQELLDQFRLSLANEPMTNGHIFFENLEKIITENEEILTDLTQSPDFSSLSYYFNEFLSQELRKILMTDNWTSDDEIRLEFYAAGTFAVYQNWLKSDKSISISDYTKFLNSNLEQIFKPQI